MKKNTNNLIPYFYIEETLISVETVLVGVEDDF